MRFVSLAAFMAVFSWPALGQSFCGERGEIVERLANKHNEYKIGQGIAADGALVEMFGSSNGWSVLVSRPGDPKACVVSVGQPGTTWQQITPPDVPGKTSH